MSGTEVQGGSANTIGGTNSSRPNSELGGGGHDSIPIGGRGGNAGAESAAGSASSVGGVITGGAAATAGAVSIGGMSATAGNANAGAAQAGSSSGTTNICGTRTAVPTTGFVTDFSEFEANTSWSTGASKPWGGASVLAGTTFFYGSSSVTVTATITNGRIRLVASLPNNTFAGFGLYFGVCADASAFSGLTAAIGGTITNAALKWQIETSGDLPIGDTPGRGECAYTSSASMWQDCAFNGTTVSGVSSTIATFKYAFSQFSGGKPETTVDRTKLLGTQWQFECPIGSGCSVDVVIDDVKFY